MSRVKRSHHIASGLALALLLFAEGNGRADDRVSACADAGERGQVLRDAKKLVEARALFVACAQRECPAAVRESCTDWLTDIDRRLPSIVVAVKDDRDRDISGFTALLDGASLSPDAAAKAMPADPGNHVLEIRAAAHEPAKVEIVLREGEGVRVVTVKLRRVESARADAPKRRKLPVVPLVLAGTAVAALGVFGYFGLKGGSDYRALERTCAPSCTTGQIDDVRSTLIVADVALAVAIATGLSAGMLVVFDRPVARSQE